MSFKCRRPNRCANWAIAWFRRPDSYANSVIDFIKAVCRWLSLIESLADDVPEIKLSARRILSAGSEEKSDIGAWI